jgi:pimeloyl-ACP methyl ester carboxylesterase
MLTAMWGFYRFGAGTALRASGARPFQFRQGETELRVWRAGVEEGEPWVLLHGLGAMAAGWLPVVRALRRECSLVLPELSALGGSRCAQGGLAVADGVPVVAGLIEQQFPSRPVTVAGNSLGGWMALRLALARPDLVARLCLIAPGGFREQDWDRIEHLLRVEDLAGAAEVVAAMFLRPPLPRPLMHRAFRRAFTSAAVVGPLGKLAEADCVDEDDLARIEVPVALLWGERDGVFDVSVAERMAAALPSGRLYRLPAAHVVQWDRPHRLVAAVQDFRARTGNAPHDARSAA